MSESSEILELRRLIENIEDDFSEIEEESNKINIFEILGISSKEIRHSKFISWLLDPNENHQLGDYFLNKFLKNVVLSNDNSNNVNTIDIFQIESLNMSDFQIKNEYKNIDILLLNERERFVCCIENKIYSKQHSDQCKRYREIIFEDFPKYNKLFIFLTVDGSTSDDFYYINYTYDQLYKILNDVYNNKKNNINSISKIYIENYLDILNKKMIENSDIKDICLKIYNKHKKALDLIFEHKPDKKEEVKDIFEIVVQELIEEGYSIELENSTKNFLRFHPVEFNKINKCTYAWKKTKNNLWFEIQPNYGENLYLVCGDRKNIQYVVDKISNFRKWDRLSDIKEGKENYSHLKLKKKFFIKDFSELEFDEIKNILKDRLKSFLDSEEYKKFVSIIESC